MRKSATRSSSLVAILCFAVYVLPIAGQATPAGAPSSACQTELFSLSPCLGFLTNNSITTAAPNCCSALTNVSAASPACLCSFLDPGNVNQGIALGVNQTRALQLPSICGLKISPTECADLAPVGAPAPSPVAGGPVPSSPASVPSPGVATPANSPAANCPAVTQSLAPCLTYLESIVSTPTAPCCESLKAATAQPECLCEIIQSPPGGVNSTAALNLPTLCDVSVLSLSTCSAASSPGGEGPTAGSSNNGAGSLLVNTGFSPSLIIFATMTATILWNGMNQQIFA